MEEKNPFLITKALKRFLWGSIFAAVASQVATTTDAIVVSHTLGPDALSGVNVVIPVLSVFTAIMLLFGVGASVVASKAIGANDSGKVNGVFSTCVLSAALIGFVLAFATYFFTPEIISVVSQKNERISGYAFTYLQKMCLAIPFLIIAGVIENFVKTDGHPRLVVAAVSAGAIVNLVLDIVFIRFMGLGVAGAAYATVINYLIALIVSSFHFGSPHSSIKWKLDFRRFGNFFKSSFKEGISTCLNSLLIAGCIYSVNMIVLRIQGADGLYCWSVCFQIFLIMQIVLTGVSSSTFALGGMLVGEEDYKGLVILDRKCLLYLILSLLCVTAVILAIPAEFGILFGNGGADTENMLPFSLRVFSLMLVPYTIVGQLRTIYQIIGRNHLSLSLSISQLVVMVIFVFAFSFIGERVMWWGFPASAVSLFLFVIVYSSVIYFTRKGVRWLTLIPKSETFPALNISVGTDNESISSAKEKLENFLTDNNVRKTIISEVDAASDKLIEIIASHDKNRIQKTRTEFFDLHVRLKDDAIVIVIKKEGKPVDELKDCETSFEKESGDRECPSMSENLKISYKYIYDQNIITLSFGY